MYKTFAAKRFRGLLSVNLEDLARVTLLAGKNDAGKTAVLEAMYLHASSFNAGAIALQRLQPYRGQFPVDLGPSGSDSPWAPFFKDLDTSEPIELFGKNSDEHSSRLRLAVPKSTTAAMLNTATAAAGESSFANSSLELSEQVGGGPERTRTQLIGIQVGLNGDVTGSPLSFQLDPVGEVARPFCVAMFIPAGTRSDLAYAYSQLRSGNFGIDLVESLRGVDGRIRGLEILTRGVRPVLHVELDGGLMLPIALLGDGPGALARFLLALVQVGRGGLVLIDEVETGVHWSVLEHMWATLSSAAERLDVQIIATTHSRECLTAASRVFRDRPSALRLFRIGPTDSAGEPIVGSYGGDSLAEGLEMNIDVR